MHIADAEKSAQALPALEKKLAKIEALARGSKLRRMLHDPLRYASAIGFWRLIYPLKKKGKFAAARTFFGAPMQVVLPSATEIFLFGAKTHDSEIRLTRFLLRNLRPGDVFCDVGAHFGYFSLLAAHLVSEFGFGISDFGGRRPNPKSDIPNPKSGRVFSFEASRSTFDILTKNIAPFSNIHAFHRAACDEDKTLTFNEFPALFSEYNSLVLPENAGWLRRNPPRQIQVTGVRLDDFFAEKNAIPSLVKIDVEGAELQVLKGMLRLLELHSPVLVMEYLRENTQNQAHRAALEFARRLGYQPFLIAANGEIERCADVEKTMVERSLTSENVVLKRLTEVE